MGMVDASTTRTAAHIARSQFMHLPASMAILLGHALRGIDSTYSGCGSTGRVVRFEMGLHLRRCGPNPITLTTSRSTGRVGRFEMGLQPRRCGDRGYLWTPNSITLTTLA